MEAYLERVFRVKILWCKTSFLGFLLTLLCSFTVTHYKNIAGHQPKAKRPRVFWLIWEYKSLPCLLHDLYYICTHWLFFVFGSERWVGQYERKCIIFTLTWFGAAQNWSENEGDGWLMIGVRFWLQHFPHKYFPNKLLDHCFDWITFYIISVKLMCVWKHFRYLHCQTTNWLSN